MPHPTSADHPAAAPRLTIRRAIGSMSGRFAIGAFVPVAVVLAAGYVVLEDAMRTALLRNLSRTGQEAEAVLKTVHDVDSEHRQRLLEVIGQTCVDCHKGQPPTPGRGTDPNRRMLHTEIMDAQFDRWGQTLSDTYVIATDPAGDFVAGVVGGNADDPRLLPFAGTLRREESSCSGCGPDIFMQVDGHVYEAIDVPINVGQRHLGNIAAAWLLDLRRLNPAGETAFFSHGRLALHTLALTLSNDLESQLLANCKEGTCTADLGDEEYLAVRADLGGHFSNTTFYFLSPTDRYVSPFLREFNTGFAGLGLASVLFALVLALTSAALINRPIRQLLHGLRESTGGALRDDFPTATGVTEIDAVAAALNEAARGVEAADRAGDRASMEFLESLALALESRDPYTAGHSERVSRNSAAIAEAMGLPAEQINVIRLGARFHDLGKIAISDQILNKPTELSAHEQDIMKRHPEIGRQIMGKVETFRPYLPIVASHHERFDGGGYPHGLSAQAIPIGARIVHVADVYDALVTGRSYHHALDAEAVEDFLVKGKGSAFDPAVVDAFLRVLRDRGRGGRAGQSA